MLAFTALWLCVTVVRAPYAQQSRNALQTGTRSAAYQPPVVRLTPIRTIGTLERPPEYAFGQLDEIAVDRSGRLYTYDQKEHQLRAYDAAGKFVAKREIVARHLETLEILGELRALDGGRYAGASVA